jgi:hypothetical protein
MKIRLLAIAVILLSVAAPSFAADLYVRHRHHYYDHHWRVGGFHDSFLHNYGPPDFYPGTRAPPDRVVVPVRGQPYGIYDGFDRYCGESTANYGGQDGRRHPCN